MHPDGIVALDQRLQRLGKALVDPLISAAKAAYIFGQVHAIMEQGPQRAIGIAIIIFIDVLLFQIDRGGAYTVIFVQPDMAGEFVRRLAGPAEPDALMLAQCRRQRDGQPALRSIGAGLLNAVGNNNQAAHL